MDRDIKTYDSVSLDKLKSKAKYTIIGEVIHGKGQGRKYGMPTANLKLDDNKELPPHGVYATICVLRGETYIACTNIGLRPSADNMKHVTVETHILDFDEDIYGEQLTLYIMQFVRPVMKFDGGIADVKKQVDLDIKIIRKIFSEEN